MSQRCFPHLQFSVLYINVNHFQIDSCPFRGWEGAIASFLRVSVFASCVLELMPKWRAARGAKKLPT